MKKFRLLPAVMILAASLFIACDPEENGENEDKNTVDTKSMTIDASGFSDWKYFSFETGKEVSAADVGDYESSKFKMNWDIAFHRGDIRTNSGASGNGKGGALKGNGAKLADIITIPTEGYAVDEEAEIMIEMSADGYRTQSKNTVLATWYSSEGMPPVYVVNDYVYVVKTADGKYAKVKFTDYTDDAGAGGHISFSYQYPVK
ncbi:HmuY family protein [Bacteroidales bacterium OttesenSCG-928-B11]|nr:HmuY family protein [Bacteroidales bacterium OttesenSCG-928-E04]MDL2308463.1 HmuY family protein [Bacteroidales bacterium OttesenSCG-928-C03]MDL2311452.1 HmuY family protein [Bacteroidales bacterium OttesenSCG-928-B11]